MLNCTHHVSWVVPVEGGRHRCLYCRALVAKKDIYPKWDDLGADYQAKWTAHEGVAHSVPLPVVSPAEKP